MSDEPCSSCAEWSASYDGLAEKCEALRRERDAFSTDNAELNALFELQQKRSLAAIQHWRKENPRNLPNVDFVTPDLGDLLTWLMKKAGLEP